MWSVHVRGACSRGGVGCVGDSRHDGGDDDYVCPYPSPPPIPSACCAVMPLLPPQRPRPAPCPAGRGERFLARGGRAPCCRRPCRSGRRGGGLVRPWGRPATRLSAAGPPRRVLRPPRRALGRPLPPAQPPAGCFLGFLGAPRAGGRAGAGSRGASGARDPRSCPGQGAPHARDVAVGARGHTHSGHAEAPQGAMPGQQGPPVMRRACGWRPLPGVCGSRPLPLPAYPRSRPAAPPLSAAAGSYCGVAPSSSPARCGCQLPSSGSRRRRLFSGQRVPARGAACHPVVAPAGARRPMPGAPPGLGCRP